LQMNATVETGISPDELERIFESGTEPDILGVNLAILEHRQPVLDIIRPSGLVEITRILPVIDHLGWAAINDIYYPKWLRAVNSEAKKTPLSDDNFTLETFEPLGEFYAHLSSVACKNVTDKFEITAARVTTPNKLHPDYCAGHTFITNPNVKIGQAQYEFRGTERSGTMGMRPNQVVIIGGSAERSLADSYKTVDHSAVHNIQIERLRLMAFAQALGPIKF